MAQLAEQLICNQQVNGSSPFISSIFLQKNNGRMPEWLKGADCKSVDGVYDGSNPSSPTKVLLRFLVKNWSEIERNRNDSDKANGF